MQQIAVNWTLFGWTLVFLFAFGVGYAMYVRYASTKGRQGNTAMAVVIGVAVTLVALIPTIGLETIALIFAGFAVAGLPMYVEYTERVLRAQQKDQEDLARATKDYSK